MSKYSKIQFENKIVIHTIHNLVLDKMDRKRDPHNEKLEIVHKEEYTIKLENRSLDNLQNDISRKTKKGNNRKAKQEIPKRIFCSKLTFLLNVQRFIRKIFFF